MGNEMGNETVDRHRCDEVASTPQSKLTIQQSPVPIEKSSSCGQATKRWRTTLMKRTEKGLVNRKSGGQGAHSETKDGLRFAVHEVAHFPDGCVCLWIRGLFQFQHFGAAQGGSSLPWFVQARDSALLPTDSRLPVALSTLHTTVSLMQRNSRHPKGPQ